jgi:hypothetical protein
MSAPGMEGGAVVVGRKRNKRPKHKARLAPAPAQPDALRAAGRGGPLLGPPACSSKTSDGSSAAAAGSNKGFGVGDRVRVAGLAKALQYNGLEGTVTGLVAAPGPPRCGVELEFEGAPKLLALAADKLALVRAAPPLDGNELLARYREQSAAHPVDMPRLLDPALPGGDARRAALLALLDVEAAARLYAWAIPDARALRILAALGPLVEVGCGKGYWARLLRDYGVDVVAYDIAPPPEPARWTALRRG